METSSEELARQPVRYRIDERNNVVFATLQGDVTFADLCATQDAMLADPDYRPAMSLYVECGDLTSIPSDQEIRKLALDRLLRGREMPVGRSAVVATSALGVAYAQAWEAFLDERLHDFRAFTSSDEACEWLGIPKDALEKR